MKAWSYLEIIDLRPHPDPTGGLPRSGGFNWPFRGTKHTVSEEGPGGAAFVWKMMKIAETKRREKQRLFACDGLVSNVNQSSRRGLSPY